MRPPRVCCECRRSPRLGPRDHVADHQKRGALAGHAPQAPAIHRSRPTDRLARRAACRVRGPPPASADRGRPRSIRRCTARRRKVPYRPRRWCADRQGPTSRSRLRPSAVFAVTKLSRVASLAERQRQPGLRRAAERRGDARHDERRHARLPQIFKLLAAAAEDERIAALEPDDAACPAFAAATRRRLISSWPMPGSPLRLPTNTRSASRRRAREFPGSQARRRKRYRRSAAHAARAASEDRDRPGRRPPDAPRPVRIALERAALAISRGQAGLRLSRAAGQERSTDRRRR